MKIHPLVDITDPLFLKRVKDLGMDKIELEEGKYYRMYKTRDKFNSKKFKSFAQEGEVFLIGKGEHVMIYIAGYSTWIRTSPIVKVKKLKKCIRLTTLNSEYEIEI